MEDSKKVKTYGDKPVSNSQRKAARKAEIQEKRKIKENKANTGNTPKNVNVNKANLDKRLANKEKSYKTCEKCKGLYYGGTINFKKYVDYKLIFEKNNVCMCSKCLAIFMKETGVLCDIGKVY